MSYQHSEVVQIYTGEIGPTPQLLYDVPTGESAIIGSFVVGVNPNATATNVIQVWIVPAGGAGIADENRILQRSRTVNTDIELIVKPWVLAEGQQLYAQSSEQAVTLLVSGSKVTNVG